MSSADRRYQGSVHFRAKGDLAAMGGFHEVKVFAAVTGQFVRKSPGVRSLLTPQGNLRRGVCAAQ